ncbi:FG-GAP-like repeat-containing protein [Frigoriglobus tundricola]|uniref:Peptidase M10 metallopeptidase domain-containing protein n=1 Tax=Frigoriglobus tundricola TaxID=2774151 RepID=A0A6M5YTZ0_9BACT|nr:FG-GAP-like repeat-containing protein [Frigoriglobus tundricola]QJW96830.1 hypothetical protein FTUN_4390 [Frigoriglobus tundricola]
MSNWLTRRTDRRPTNKVRRPALRLEALEAREVPAVAIQINYSLDSTGFFTNNPAAQAILQQAANELGNSLNENLSAITPSGSNTWNATFFDPRTGSVTSVANLNVAANTLVVFVGARALNSSEAGYGGYGGYSSTGTAAWNSTIQTRGATGFAPWGGSVTFDTTQNWYFGQSASVPSNQLDFYSVAEHELGHILGIGTSPQWTNLSQGGYFLGANAEAVYGGPVPVTADDGHWANNLTVNGARGVMDPSLPYGTRVNWSALDAAALRDLGWNSTAAASPPVSPPPPALPPATVALSGSANGTVALFSVVNGALYQNGQAFTPFPGYTGEIRMTAGDFNGDGVTDYAFTNGTGSPSVIEIVDGRTGGFLLPPTAPFGAYSGGLYLAAGDIDHNGQDQLIVAGQNAPPIVLIYQVANGGLQLQMSFIAFDAPWFGGGIRVAAGDLNGDGYADVVVSTASQVGAVATYSGAALAHGQVSELFPMFFLVPGSPVGLNVAVGNLENNGYDDLAITFGTGGPGVVAIWSGAVLTQNPTTSPMNLPLAALFLAVPGNQGARLATVDVNGSGVDQLIVTSADPSNSLVRLYTFAQAQAGVGSVAYPLGTSTINGVYAADHVQPANSDTTQNPDATSPPPPSTTANTNTTYTVTAAPPNHKCTCPACTALANIATGASLIASITVK